MKERINFSSLYSGRKAKRDDYFEVSDYPDFFIVERFEVEKNPFLKNLSQEYSKEYLKVRCIRESESVNAILISDSKGEQQWIPKSKVLGYKKGC